MRAADFSHPGNSRRKNSGARCLRTPRTVCIRSMRLAGIELTALMRAVVHKRWLPVSPRPALIPWLIPCSRPNSRKATTIDSIVRMVRVFLRHRPAQMSMKYFMRRWATLDSSRRPLSTCRVVRRDRPPCGSCVTMMMVLPCCGSASAAASVFPPRFRGRDRRWARRTRAGSDRPRARGRCATRCCCPPDNSLGL